MKLWMRLAIPYAIVIAIVSAAMFVRVPSDSSYVLTHLVHRDHRIVEDDVRYSGGPGRRSLLPWLPPATEFVGRYAKREIPSGAELRFDDTSLEPALLGRRDRFVYWHPIGAPQPSAAESAADVGRFADLCGTICITDLQIAGRSCERGTSAKTTMCFVGLWIPVKSRTSLLALLHAGAAKTKDSRLDLILKQPDSRRQ